MPPSVMWHRPDLKSGVKFSWQGLLHHDTELTSHCCIVLMPSATLDSVVGVTKMGNSVPRLIGGFFMPCQQHSGIAVAFMARIVCFLFSQHIHTVSQHTINLHQ